MSGNVPGSWDEHEHFTPGKAVTHTMGHYPENGPPFCQECTDAWKNWVTWPCAGGTSRRRLDQNVVRRLRRPSQHLTRDSRIAGVN